MKTVAIVGKKGGIGKSTLSHLLCFGAIWSRTPAYMLHTDDKKPMTVNERPYVYLDARDGDMYNQYVARLKQEDKGIMVIDGAASREAFTSIIAPSVDLVLLPVEACEESIDLANDTMRRLESEGMRNSAFLINKYPTNAKELERAKHKYYSRIDSSRCIGNLKKVAGVNRMTESDHDQPWTTPPTVVSSTARALYRCVAGHLIDIEKSRSPATQVDEGLEPA